jgi:hypothetical protein
LQDEYAKVVFLGSSSHDITSEELKEDNCYMLRLKSKHMKSEVTNKIYPAVFSKKYEMRDKYSMRLKKDAFLKFFSIFKQEGAAVIRANHHELLEMEFTVQKCPNISVVLHTSARKI